LSRRYWQLSKQVIISRKLIYIEIQANRRFVAEAGVFALIPGFGICQCRQIQGYCPPFFTGQL
jgi:hypothetical protein